MDDRDQGYWSAVQDILSQLNAETDPVTLARQIVQERARGGGAKRLLIDQYPTKYLPNVGRQVMADGGMPAYRDAPTQHIEDWQWRPLEDVKDQLQLTEIPSHVAAFGQFMDETANRAGTQGLSARDLIKAYTITRASIQRRARPADALRQAGLDLPTAVEGMVRPEGAFGHWLHTPMGQKYLKFAEQGQVDDEAVRNAVQIMAPFGKHEKDIPDALIWAAKNLPGQEAHVSRLVAAAQQMQSAPQEWRDMATQFRGIGPSKSGFVASIMGRGDQPTLDARQVILHTGRPTSEAQPFLRRKKHSGATEAVERLADRQAAMGLDTPPGLEPYYQHLAHHAVWDKASNETTTHQDVIDAMRHAAAGGRIEDEDNPILNHPVAQVMASMGASEGPEAPAQFEKLPVLYRSWADVPTINPQDLVGKKVFPIFADLTKAGSAFRGIDASKLDQPEQLYGGPGYPLLPESQEHGLGWAVEGKGRGTSKLLKDADYVAVSAMEPYSHQSNASFSNALMKNMAAYVRDQRLTPDGLAEINKMITAPSAQKDLKGLESFPGFEHPDAEKFLRDMTFEQRKRVSQVLASRAAQDLGAPNIDKITRATLDPEFSGVPSRHAMFLLKIPRSKSGAIDETEMNKLLVHLKDAGLPEHPSYQYGLRGSIVGKFHAPVAPEILFKDWFDEARANAAKKEKSNVRRAFDLAMPVATISQEVADMLPRHPRDIQSGKAAQLALNAFNDMWDSTDTPVNKGGLGPAELSQALKNSDASSTLSQYSPKEIKDMSKGGKFTGFKLKGGEVYFGLKRGTNYADEYGFEHPELTPNETALVSVVNNEPGAKGIGGAPVVLKAIQHGATALDCFAVPSNRHPNGFLPEFYANFGFQELGRVPFDPKYVSPQQFEDMKHEWTKAGWNENMGLPALSIMKWKGDENDRTDAVRRHLEQSSASDRPGSNSADVGSAAGLAEQGSQPASGAAQGERGLGDEGRDRGAVRNDRAPRPADRLARTLAEIKQLSPAELAHYGLRPEDVESARARGLASGGKVDEIGDRYERSQEGPFYRLARKDLAGHGRVSEGLRPEVREAEGALPGGSGGAGDGDPALSAAGSSPGVGNRVESLARDYIQQVHGRELTAPKLESSLAKQSAIGRSFAEAAKGTPEYKRAIFDAYARMMPEVVEQSGATNYDQLLERAYRQMAQETSQQFERLPFRMSFHRAGEGDYKSSKHMLDDLHNNNHLYVFQGGDPHEFLHNVDPETGLNENEKFRAVHDVFGHGIYGNPFGAKGEENAWAVHSQMYSPLARLAMTAETRGQNSFVNYTPINAALKEKLAETEERIADARRNRNEFAMELAQKKKNLLFKEFQFAPQKAVLLPPEFLSPEYQGGMPEYMRSVIKPEPGTGFSSALTHYSTVPDMERTDPSRYGTGIPGDEASRLRSRPGGVKERSYFYLGEPETVTPEEGLGSYRYRTEASDLYDITKDPLNFKTLARESNRMPWSSNFNPGTVEPGQFANDLERLVKEYGYKGFANPNAAFPMAVTFDPTQVERRAAGGEVGDEAPYHQTPEFQNWFGDSVAHMDGVPITYYHGTSKDKDFPSFNVGRHGTWLTSNPEEASQYAEQNDSQDYKYEGGKYVKTNTASRVIPVHLKAENPYLGEKPEELFQQQNYKKAQSDWFDGLRAQGYDSWIPASQNGALAVILKEPTQIKSIYNRKFDPKNKRMDKAAGGEAENPDIPQIDNAVSVFPKPQRMFPEDAPVAGGQYLNAATKEDMTGHKAAMASIGVQPGGKPYFRASPDSVDETGTPGRGSAIAKTNLFKQKAGWKWAQAPEGHEATDTIVSVAHRGQHHYTLNAHFPKGVDLARYENSPTEPRLRPTTKGNVTFGPKVGSILVRGKEHPVYEHVIVKNMGGEVSGGKAAGGHVATLRRMSDPAVNEAIRVINRSGSSPRDAVTLSKRLLGRQ